MCRPRSNLRFLFALTAFSVGLVIFLFGFYLQTQDRTGAEDDFSWRILAVGTVLLAGGASLPFVHPLKAIIIASISPFVAFAFAVFMFWAIAVLMALVRFLL
jgi:hypothetical protein